MLKITQDVENTGIFRLNLYGRLTGEYVPEIEKALRSNGSANNSVVLNLTNVTLVDRLAMEFLRAATLREIKIENLPSYVARWIKQEGSDDSRRLESEHA